MQARIRNAAIVTYVNCMLFKARKFLITLTETILQVRKEEQLYRNTILKLTSYRTNEYFMCATIFCK